jgi:hypothetical protein
LAAVPEEHGTAARERLIALLSADVGDRLALYVHEGGVDFPQEIHIALATA